MNKPEFLYYLLQHSIINKLPEQLRDMIEDIYLEECVDSVMSDHPHRTLYDLFQYGITGSREFKDMELLECLINWDYELNIKLHDYFSNIDLIKYMIVYERQLQS